MITELEFAHRVASMEPEVFGLTQEIAVAREKTNGPHGDFVERVLDLTEQWKQLYDLIQDVETKCQRWFQDEAVKQKHLRTLTGMRTCGSILIILLQRAEDQSDRSFELLQGQLRFGIRALTITGDLLH